MLVERVLVSNVFGYLLQFLDNTRKPSGLCKLELAKLEGQFMILHLGSGSAYGLASSVKSSSSSVSLRLEPRLSFLRHYSIKIRKLLSSFKVLTNKSFISSIYYKFMNHPGDVSIWLYSIFSLWTQEK